MIYCAGYAQTYDFLPVGSKKAGPKPEENNYPGGSVWKTAEEAHAYLKASGGDREGYCVYALDADWEKDVSKDPEPGYSWHNLLVDATIVGKVLGDGSLIIHRFITTEGQVY